MIRLIEGDNLIALRALPSDLVDAVVCDPPYGLGTPPDPLEMLRAWTTTGHLDVGGRGFMGREWDAFVPQPATWREVFRVMKPGAHLVAFFGTRTYDVGALALRLAGFEIRDQLAWVYGSGFPKSHDVSKGIDAAAGATRERIPIGNAVKRMIPGAKQISGGSWIKQDGREFQPGIEIPATDVARQWQGWGTALKPAWEPIILARKPLAGSVAANVLEHGTGALNVDGCRIGERWPANLIHDGSDEVVEMFPTNTGAGAPVRGDEPSKPLGGTVYGHGLSRRPSAVIDEKGSAARFFYAAKASAADRAGSKHPTIKPVALMRWLCRLVTPPGGLILDPYAGSGTTGAAAREEGFAGILMEREPEYVGDIRRRLGLTQGFPGGAAWRLNSA